MSLVSTVFSRDMEIRGLSISSHHFKELLAGAHTSIEIYAFGKKEFWRLY